MNENNNETKENFCGLCVSVPLAFAGVGASVYGTRKGSHKKQKKISLIIGFIAIAISIFIAIYYSYIKKCSKCE